MRAWFRRNRLPRLRSGIGQTLLTSPQVVDQIRRDMLAGNYDYKLREDGLQDGGVHGIHTTLGKDIIGWLQHWRSAGRPVIARLCCD